MSEPLTEEVNVVPFYLTRPEVPSQMVEVVEPLQANYITEDLKTTHTAFKPSTDGVLKTIVKAAFGNASRSIFEKEEMITVGAKLFAVGQISKSNGDIILEPPQNGKDYIITTQSKRELLSSIRNASRFYKILALTFGGIGLAFLIYKLTVKVRKLLLEHESRSMFEEVRRRLREQAASRPRRRRRNSLSSSAVLAPDAEAATNAKGDVVGFDDQGDSSCVVCLQEERNVVLLNCGHICVCVNCAELLPQPKVCPVCRAPVERVIPVYHP